MRAFLMFKAHYNKTKQTKKNTHEVVNTTSDETMGCVRCERCVVLCCIASVRK